MPTAEVAEQFDDPTQQHRAGVLGMWLFLSTELLLFGGLFTAFTVFRVQYSDTFAEAASHLDLALATSNTALLLTSGLTMALAEHSMSERKRRLTLIFLFSTLVLGAVFLGLKGYEWHHEYRQSLMPVLNLPFHYPGAQPQIAELFFNLYYTMTGLHAAHMLIGLGLLAVAIASVKRWHQPARSERQVVIMGLYWAFVDVIWIVVFTLLYLLRT